VEEAVVVWIREHRDDLKTLIATAEINAEPEQQFSFLLSYPGVAAFQSPARYLSTEAAKLGADSLIRERHVHRCETGCNKWHER
jgi:hypothetical protein